MLTSFFERLLPESAPIEITGYDLDIEHHHLTLKAVSTQQSADCPLCKTATHRVHSHYHRTLTDLPCVHFSLVIVLEVCKFFCDNSDCPRRIFTERLPKIAAPWARKTVRLAQRLQYVALALRGCCGVKVSHSIGVGRVR